MSSLTPRRIALAGVLAFAMLPYHYLLSQSRQPTPDEIAARFAGAENAWRLNIVDPKTQVDSVAPDIREARNAYGQPGLQAERDFEKTGNIQTYSGPAPAYAELVSQRDIWVVAKFVHSLVIPIDPDYKLLYTEMSFQIDQVVRQPSTSSLSNGMSFVVDDEGGRIKKPNGDIESWHIGPTKYYPQPEHTYLRKL